MEKYEFESRPYSVLIVSWDYPDFEAMNKMIAFSTEPTPKVQIFWLQPWSM